MKINFNWGWKIAILYGSFVCLMLFMVYKTSKEKVELVSENYYEKELQYQGQLDKQNRANALAEKLEWRVSGSEITMNFPKLADAQNVSGNIHFYCPADEKSDFNYPFSATPSQPLSVKSDKIHHGTYKMKIDWKEGQTEYYTEGVISIQ